MWRYLLDPTPDFSQRAGARAVAILAHAVAAAGRAVQKVLLHPHTHVRAKLGRLAGEHAVEAVARPGVVAGCQTAHDGAALLVTRGALATGTLQPGATAGAVFGNNIGRTGGAAARAFLLGIAFSIAGTADGVCRRKLASLTTILV